MDVAEGARRLIDAVGDEDVLAGRDEGQDRGGDGLVARRGEGGLDIRLRGR